MPDNSLTKLMLRMSRQLLDGVPAEREERRRRHARRLIFVGYAPDAVRGMLRLQPTDKLWDEVQSYYEERKSKHGNSNG